VRRLWYAGDKTSVLLVIEMLTVWEPCNSLTARPIMSSSRAVSGCRQCRLVFAGFDGPVLNAQHFAELRAHLLQPTGRGLESQILELFRRDPPHFGFSALITEIPNSRRYQLLPQGYSICLVFLKLFERIYAPLTSGRRSRR
jgi:hypothetical protein